VCARDLYVEGLEEVSTLSETEMCTEMVCDSFHPSGSDSGTAVK
jgi:hypothetical protein